MLKRGGNKESVMIPAIDNVLDMLHRTGPIWSVVTP
jgi:hypothetical protein